MLSVSRSCSTAEAVRSACERRVVLDQTGISDRAG
jgi:hypothetical protein